MNAFIYYNLHRHVWSIKALEGPKSGLVIAHADNVYLKDAIGSVSEKGRQRVLRERSKNVHAGIVGELIAYTDGPTEAGDLGFPGLTEVTYNPYKYSTFVYKDTEEEYCGSEIAVLSFKKVYTL